MGFYIDPNNLRVREEVMRANALKGVKNTVPDGKRDKKFLLITIGAIAAVVAALVLPVVIVNLFA
ncbi:MAG: hypothetical protein PUB32_02265 [Clostridiales bacterium]|nr:hypothetical protein [Clostridiales bacterium]